MAKQQTKVGSPKKSERERGDQSPTLMCLYLLSWYIVMQTPSPIDTLLKTTCMFKMLPTVHKEKLIYWANTYRLHSPPGLLWIMSQFFFIFIKANKYINHSSHSVSVMDHKFLYQLIYLLSATLFWFTFPQQWPSNSKSVPSVLLVWTRSNLPPSLP